MQLWMGRDEVRTLRVRDVNGMGWDGVWRWSECRDGMESVEGIDFTDKSKTLKTQDQRGLLQDHKTSKGGAKSKDLLMTIDTFKGWAMAAQTARGKDVRKSFISFSFF